MKFTREREIQQIFEEAGQSENALLEINRLNRLLQILTIEFSEKLSTIWTINAKIDKLRKELNHE